MTRLCGFGIGEVMQERLRERKKIRLQGYDYSQAGCYFITICVKDGHEMLGCIDVGAIINRPLCELSDVGKIVDEAIKKIPTHYPQIFIDKYVIMPNHIHMILVVRSAEESGRLIIAPTSVSVVVKQLKRHVSKKLGFSLWQKSFHDYIIRDKDDYQRIWQYIDENPSKWTEDCYFVNNKGS